MLTKARKAVSGIVTAFRVEGVVVESEGIVASRCAGPATEVHIARFCLAVWSNKGLAATIPKT